MLALNEFMPSIYYNEVNFKSYYSRSVSFNGAGLNFWQMIDQLSYDTQKRVLEKFERIVICNNSETLIS